MPYLTRSGLPSRAEQRSFSRNSCSGTAFSTPRLRIWTCSSTSRIAILRALGEVSASCWEGEAPAEPSEKGREDPGRSARLRRFQTPPSTDRRTNADSRHPADFGQGGRRAREHVTMAFWLTTDNARDVPLDALLRLAVENRH